MATYITGIKMLAMETIYIYVMVIDVVAPHLKKIICSNFIKQYYLRMYNFY